MKTLLWSLAVMTGLLVTAADAKPLPKGNRILSLSTTLASDGNFEKALKLAKRAGVESMELAVYWDELETSPGVFAPAVDYLAMASSYYPSRGVKVNLEILVIDTNHLRLPADLQGRALDDPIVVCRFEKLLEYVMPKCRNLELTSLAIGNEIDSFLRTDAKKWSQFQKFYRAGATHAKTLRKGLKVGSKATFGGYTGASSRYLKELNRHTDLILVNHYLISEDFGVRPPSEISKDFATIVTMFPARRIFFTELGYPASPLLGGSEELQAEFVRETFKAWDQYKSQIKLVEFVWLHDISQEQLKTYETYYGSNHPRFSAFLSSLGLRTNAGRSKAGYGALVKEAKARGW